jgi:hypothetical protein
MYIGHYAIALGAKKIAPRISLGTLFLAAIIIDLLMSILLLVGVEHLRIAPGITVMTPLDLYDYPVSHSLATSLAWSVIFAAIYYFIKHSIKDSLIIGSTVFSHWVLDFITHTTDLALFPGSDIKVGLGIWNNVAASVLIEGLLFAVGLFIYFRSTKAKDKKGDFVLWLLMAFLLLSWIASMFSPPPPDAMAIAVGNQIQWIVIIIAYWIDSHRGTRIAG